MSFWTNVLIIVHVLVALSIIGLVLLQHGKGADMGSGFGGGASSSLFGATGSANFLSRATAALATVFFLLSLALAYIASNRPHESASVIDRASERQQPAAPKGADKKEAAPAVPSAPAQGTAPASEPGRDKNVPQ
jgi:preprotein translocase subunit SecG